MVLDTVDGGSLVLRVLKRGKYVIGRAMSPKVYWYLMGRLRAVRAVTSNYGTVAESMGSGLRLVELLDDLGVIGPDMTTLQIGSGLGRVEYYLRDRVRQCYGADVSGAMVQRARRLVPYENVSFVQSDGLTLDAWVDGSLDLIYSFFVFQHVPRAQFGRYVSEAYKKLRLGGHLVFQLLVDEAQAEEEPPINHPYGIRYYRRTDVEGIIRGAGFELVGRTDLAGSRDDGSNAAGDVVFTGRKV